MKMNERKGLNIQKILSRYGIYVVIGMMMIVFTILNNRFLLPANLMNIVRQASIMVILASGTTFIMVAGVIDISVGAVACLSGMLCAYLMKVGVDMYLAIAAGLVVGMIMGSVSGILVAYLNMAPMIATMAVMNFCNGAAKLITGGTAIYDLPKQFQFWGRGYVFGKIPTQVIVMIVVVFITSIVLSRTPFGRKAYAIGGNKTVAQLSGIAVKKHIVLYYMINGIGCALAGILMTSRVCAALPELGADWCMENVTAIVLGGTSITGGSGTAFGSMIGAILLVMITNGLNINGVNSYWQLVITAIILVVTIVVYRKEAD